MIPVVLQLAPRPSVKSVSFSGTPPVAATTFTELPVKNPIERPSGGSEVAAVLPAIQLSSEEMSCALCQRSSGSLIKQFFTTRSSAGGVIGWTAEIGLGSSRKIAEIREAWLDPVNAFAPVAIS